jgi:MarR family transcriptional regulator, organic hydroperoxide resistance regulator
LTQTLAFMRLLWAVDHGLRSCSKRMHARLGLTGPQRLALRMIGSFPGLSLSELADLLHVDRGTLTGILERLVTRGFVLRRLDPTDARRSMLRLTDKGRRLNQATAGTIESKVQRALASVSATKVAASKSVLEALAAELTPEKTRLARTNTERRNERRRI